MGRSRRYLGINELVRVDLRDSGIRQKLRPFLEVPDKHKVIMVVDGVPLRLTFAACRFGGWRAWFICDGCGSRRLVLHRREIIHKVASGNTVRESHRQHVWRCRKCWHLTYPSQRACREWSYYAQIRIEALVRGFAPGWHYADDFPDKPPRIRWRTWTRLSEAVNKWEAVRDAVFLRKVSRYMPRPT